MAGRHRSQRVHHQHSFRVDQQKLSFQEQIAAACFRVAAVMCRTLRQWAAGYYLEGPMPAMRSFHPQHQLEAAVRVTALLLR